MDSLDAERVEWIANMHENRIESPEAHTNMVGGDTPAESIGSSLSENMRSGQANVKVRI